MMSLLPCQRTDEMKDELFEELVASAREGGAILRGEVAPA